jgi:hypothetical protein
MKKLVMLVLFSGMAAWAFGQDSIQEGYVRDPSESKTEAKIEKGAEETEDALQKGAEKTGEGIEKGADKTKETWKDVKNGDEDESSFSNADTTRISENQETYSSNKPKRSPGQKVEDGVDKTGKAIERGWNNTEEGVERGWDNTEEKTKKAKKDIKASTHKKDND